MADANVKAPRVEVAPTGSYLQLTNGQPFIVTGQNDAITWRPSFKSCLCDGDVAACERYLQTLSGYGVNTIRMMLEYTQEPFGLIESPLGEYSPSVVKFWDTLMPLLEKYGIYLIVTPWETFWITRTWETNPHNVKNGGPINSMSEFLTNPTAREHQRRRIQFMIERWGGSPNILSWELMNEIEHWSKASFDVIDDWISEMAGFARQVDTEKWGCSRPISVSSFQSQPTGRLAEIVFNHPELDFASIHQYVGPGVNRPSNTIDAALEVRQATYYALSHINDGRPVLDTESGPISNWWENDSQYAEYYHNMSWAQLATGMAGQGLAWPYRRPPTLTEEMRRIQLGMRRFTEAFQWQGFTPKPIFMDMQVIHQKSKVHPFGIADDHLAIFWLLNNEPQEIVTDAVLTVAHRPKGVYRLVFWNTYDGVVLGEDRYVVTDGILSVALDTITRSIAIAAYREE